MASEETVSGQSLIGPSIPPDNWSWFLRDVDNHYSHKRLLAFFFSLIYAVGLIFKLPYEMMSLTAMLIAGFGGLSVIERWQPK